MCSVLAKIPFFMVIFSNQIKLKNASLFRRNCIFWIPVSRASPWGARRSPPNVKSKFIRKICKFRTSYLRFRTSGFSHEKKIKNSLLDFLFTNQPLAVLFPAAEKNSQNWVFSVDAARHRGELLPLICQNAPSCTGRVQLKQIYLNKYF